MLPISWVRGALLDAGTVTCIIPAVQPITKHAALGAGTSRTRLSKADRRQRSAELGRPVGLQPSARVDLLSERTVVSPFDADEVFSDAAAGSLRLPRRQAGSSPQSLAVTLIADYTLRDRGWLPSAAIVSLLGEFGVTAGTARTTISRLGRRGVLESSRQGRESVYRLTGAAADSLLVGSRSIAVFGLDAKSWDGFWTLLTFTLPNEEKVVRNAFRGHLRWRGFAPLYDGVWVSPHALSEQEHADLIAVAPAITAVFRAEHVQYRSGTGRSPVQAWDLDSIAADYSDFVQRWQPMCSRVLAGEVKSQEAVVARTEVMDTYRRFPSLDPLLPDALMPPDWPRALAREVFVTVYDALVEPAEAHVRAVAGEPSSGIRAHTVADMTSMSTNE